MPSKIVPEQALKDLSCYSEGACENDSDLAGEMEGTIFTGPYCWNIKHIAM